MKKKINSIAMLKAMDLSPLSIAQTTTTCGGRSRLHNTFSTIKFFSAIIAAVFFEEKFVAQMEFHEACVHGRDLINYHHVQTGEQFAILVDAGHQPDVVNMLPIYVHNHLDTLKRQPDQQRWVAMDALLQEIRQYTFWSRTKPGTQLHELLKHCSQGKIQKATQAFNWVLSGICVTLTIFHPIDFSH